MRSSTIVKGADAGRVALRFYGDFDRQSAVELRDRVASLQQGEVLLDFSHVHHFDDLGVATLARLLVENKSRRFALRGLCRHQLRLFHYIGIEYDAVTGTARPTVP